MAKDIESLVLTMSADLRRFEKSMASMRQTADKRLTEVERRAMQSQRSLSNIMARTGRDMTASLRASLAGIAPALAAAFSTAAVVKYGDAYTNLKSRLKATGLEGERLLSIENQLFDAANRNGVAIDAVAQMYQRVSQSRQALGASDADLIALTNGVTAALRVQGVSAEQASGPLLQLGQALGAGTVRAEELNSLLEGTPVLLQAAAQGSARFGGDIAKLSAAIRQGEVSSKDFFQMLLTGLPALEQQAASLPKTVGQAFQILDNQLGRFVGQADQSLSATQRMAEGIAYVANHLEDLRDVVVVVSTLLGSVLAAKALGSAIVSFTAFRTQIALANAQLAAFEIHSGLASASLGRMTVAGTAGAAAMRGLGGAMAFFGGPIGLAITALAAGIAVLAVNSGRAKREAAELAQRITDEAKAAGIAAEETKKLAGEVTATETWAASLTGELDKLTDANYRVAASAKAAAIEMARMRLETAQKTLGDAQAAYDRRRSRERGYAGSSLAAGARSGIGPDGRPLGDVYGDANRRVVSSSEYTNIRTATATVEVLTKNLRDLMSETLGARVARSAGGGGLGGGNAGGGRGGSVGAVSDEARRVEQLRAEVERLSYDLLSDTERAAVDLAKVRDTLRAAVSAGVITPSQAARLEAGAAARDLTIGDLPDVNPIEVPRDIARGVVDGMLAEQQAFLDRGRDMARSFVDILRSGNIGEELGYRFKQAAFDGLEDVLSTLFAGLMQSNSNGGGGWVSAIANLFAGKRASGGGVVRGQAYITGERRPEVFVPNTSGTIIPSVNTALSRVQQAQGRLAQPVVVQLSVEEGALFEPRVQAISGSVSVQTTGMGLAHVQKQSREAHMRQRQRFA